MDAINDFPELDTVADLELCGLSRRTIETLDRHGYVYIRNLETLTEEDLASWPNVNWGTVAGLRRALRNYRAERRTKTVEECLRFPPPKHQRKAKTKRRAR